MKFSKILIFVILGLLSCKNDNPNYDDLIIGEWNRPINLEVEAQPPGCNDITYVFFSDSAFYSPGLYKVIDLSTEIVTREYIGNMVKYKIFGDSLLLYFPHYLIDSSTFNIVKYQIAYLTHDTLILKAKDSSLFIYKRIIDSSLK